MACVLGHTHNGVRSRSVSGGCRCACLPALQAAAAHQALAAPAQGLGPRAGKGREKARARRQHRRVAACSLCWSTGRSGRPRWTAATRFTSSHVI